MTVGVAVVGLGFMGQTHLQAYQAARRDGADIDVVAVCDRDERRRRGEVVATGNIATTTGDGLFDPDIVRGYADASVLFDDPRVDAVSICTHTDSHVDLAIRALEAGKHVLVEKPVALRTGDIERLERVHAGSDCICMPAMCMRFWPGWREIHECIADARYGRARSVRLRRVGAPPNWAPEFYHDPSRSGSALVDLHIHDVDFAYWCFGAPKTIAAFGDPSHMTVAYEYDDGPRQVVIEGAWIPVAGFAFTMQATVVFDSAVLDFDLSRSPPFVVTEGGETRDVELEDRSGYDGEIRHFVACIEGGRAPAATLSEARAVTEILERERTLLREGDS